MCLISLVYIGERIYQSILDVDLSWECVLYNLGGKYAPSIALRYQVHRLFIAMFLQADGFFLFLNLLTMFFFSFRAELLLITKLRFIGLVITSGVIGNLTSSVLNKKAIGVGFSPTLFGIMTVCVVWFIAHFDQLKAMACFKMMILSIIIILQICFSFITLNGQIDAWAALGGVVSGALYTLMFLPGSTEIS